MPLWKVNVRESFSVTLTVVLNKFKFITVLHTQCCFLVEECIYKFPEIYVNRFILKMVLQWH
ncbi:hypothetical protein P5673_017372 [Acropora cervicornis]|uniref:Uncharacterized protein n=1 Tax=Acropora cervicornis TaxID=6130 RepID=A0AAD9QEJ6_ACRCE|nr:hypothetical protein P5673_017372 [Acropora cervicornis]